MSRASFVLISLLIIAFTLQLIPLFSVPITNKLTLCTFGGYKFGVFGFCYINGKCTRAQIGYLTSTMEKLSVSSLPSNTRQSISKLLVVHPISAGFTGVLTVMSGIVHFAGIPPSKTLQFMFVILLWSLPTFLLSLLSFLVDILLFAPHLDWCGWLLLVSTVLIAVSGAMLCVIRRSRSSRAATDLKYQVLSSQNGAIQRNIAQPSSHDSNYMYYDDDWDETSDYGYEMESIDGGIEQR